MESKQIVLVVGLMFLVMGTNYQVRAISCSDAGSDILPCLGYLLGSGDDTPSPECCKGVQSLNNEANTPEARKTICDCLVDAAKTYPIDFDKANQLPKQCGVTLPFPISADIDCNTGGWCSSVDSGRMQVTASGQREGNGWAEARARGLLDGWAERSLIVVGAERKKAAGRG
ncbi:hypothetical protein ACFE04_028752 [Oxalis oulophora]